VVIAVLKMHEVELLESDALPDTMQALQVNPKPCNLNPKL